MSLWFRTYGFGEIADNLLIGAYPLDQDDVAMLGWMGVREILNLVEDDEYGPGERDAVTHALAAAQIHETRLELTDFGGLAPPALEQAVETVIGWLDAGALTYVHCRAGWQRSAAVGAGVVAVRDGLAIEEALAFVKRAKPSADPLEHQREDLHRWWEQRGDRRPRSA